MPIIRKKYELLGMNSCKIALNYCRIPINVVFANGNIANHINAYYTTDNKFIQDAIENDKRFKVGTIKCVQSNTIKADEPKPAEKKEEPAVSEEPEPRRTRPATPSAGGTNAEKKGEEDAPAQDSYTAIESVKNVNDAIDFFSEKGEAFSTDEELAALKDKYKVSFPNYK